MITNDYGIRIAMLEERLIHLTDIIERIEVELNSTAQKLEVIEKQEPMQTLASKWVISAVWTAAGGAIYLIAKFFGVL